jgi:predicted nucleic acid-binding protein
MKILLDTSAWVEYLLGSEIGEKVNQYLKDNEIITSVITLFELSYKADRERWNIKNCLNFIKIESQIIGIKESSIIEFGRLYNETRKKESSFGFADAIVLLTANTEKAQIVTKDNHFRNIENAVVLK